MKTIVYYDIIAWESVEIDSLDELKDRAGKMINLLDGLGIIKFELKTSESETKSIEQGEPNEQQSNN